jgi:hypothetical protein
LVKLQQRDSTPSPFSSLYRLLIENSEANAYDEEGNETDSLGLTGFERAQLANLAVETVEEAKNLIPT